MVWFFKLFGWNNKGGPLGKWSHIFELIKYNVNRLILQGEVVKVLDIFRLN
jgi:hypothetical protein